MDEWFRHYYGRDYAASVESRLTPERTRSEIDFLVSLMGLDGVPRRVADLGAGKGRHAIELKRRGHAVTAVDLNPAFVEAGRRAEPPGVPPVRWVTGDMRQVIPGPYDAVLISSCSRASGVSPTTRMRISWRTGLGRLVPADCLSWTCGMWPHCWHAGLRRFAWKPCHWLWTISKGGILIRIGSLSTTPITVKGPHHASTMPALGSIPGEN